jgi:endonuclease/exonuclease/phosphatase family metal-dependent hydrolase
LRLLVYNIRYATGTGPAFHLPFPGAGYLRSSRRVLDEITKFVKDQDPDIVGLIEVDIGSVRSGMLNQAEHIAESLGHYSTYECKYGKSSINNPCPSCKQGNAFLAAPRVEASASTTSTPASSGSSSSSSSTVCASSSCTALKYRQRQYQLRYLHDLIAKSHKPVIVTGDFNTFWGTHEIYLFMRAAGLRSANEKNLPSFPARVPRIELDFVLVSKEIEVTNFQVPDVRFSDHRPILCDFTVRGAEASQTAVA